MKGGECKTADSVLLRFTYLDTPISGRYPACGYEGTAYTLRGIERTKKFHFPLSNRKNRAKMKMLYESDRGH